MPRSPSSNGATPVTPMPVMDTGRAATATMSIIGSKPTPIPIQAQAAEDPKQFIKDLAKELGGGGGSSGRKFLGMDLDWSRVMLAVAAAGVFLFTWYTTVNQGLEERPTTQQMEAAVEKEVAEKVSIHSQQVAPHPGIERQLGDISKGQEAMHRKIEEGHKATGDKIDNLIHALRQQ